MPRSLLMELHNVESAMSEDREVRCPAGEKIGETLDGPACFCRLEGSRIAVARDISSWSVYCTGRNEIDSRTGYQVCPTWRLAREAEWEHEAVMKLTAPSGLRRNYTVEDLMEMDERRAAGDDAGARAIGERINESRREQGLLDVSRE